MLRQAQTHLRSGNLAAADELGRQLVARNKRDGAALAILGAVAFQRGLYQEAATRFGRCATLSPNDPDVHCNLAKAWAAQGRLDRAVACFDKALRARRDHPAAIAGKADLLERRGEDDRVRALLRPFIEGGRLEPEMAIALARLEKRQGIVEAAIALADEHLARVDLSSTLRRQFGYVRGQALERAGRNDEAFEAYVRVNEQGRVPFDAAAMTERFDRLERVFSPESLAALPRASSDGGRAVFIVGMPRTGSTLIERIIDAHPKASGVGEIDAIPEILRSLAFDLGSAEAYPECVGLLDADDAERLGRRYLESIGKASSRVAVRIADKYLANYEHLGLISRLLPGARVIHVRRDPLDTCISCFAQGLAPRKHPYASDLGDLGRAYRLHDRLTGYWRRVLDLPWLEVVYEDLVRDQEGQSRAMIEFLGLEWDDRCLLFHESPRDVMTLSYDQVRRPMYAGSIGRWRRFESHIGPLREALEEEN